jgi:hypothetical protein
LSLGFYLVFVFMGSSDKCHYKTQRRSTSSCMDISLCCVPCLTGGNSHSKFISSGAMSREQPAWGLGKGFTVVSVSNLAFREKLSCGACPRSHSSPSAWLRLPPFSMFFVESGGQQGTPLPIPSPRLKCLPGLEEQVQL